MEGPNIVWGEPLGTFEIEISPGGGTFIYRQPRKAGMHELHIPMSVQELAEMKALLNVLDFRTEIDLGEALNGRKLLAN